MKFTKMQGIGNDYIYFNGFEEKIENPSLLSVILSDRHFGVGGDGIILVNPSDKADAEMRIFNADGSEAKMCGNGIRCVGKFVYDKGIAKKDILTIDTMSGLRTLHIYTENGSAKYITVDMGKPILNTADIPMKTDSETFIDKELVIDGKKWKGTAVSMGNPHFVVFTDNVKELDLEKIGPKFEFSEYFPDRVNTEFVEKTEDGLFMRVWERGSGETFACGTGASAVMTAANLTGICGKKCKIHLLGGDLDFELNDDGHIMMTGPAEFTFEGTVSEQLVEKYNKGAIL